MTTQNNTTVFTADWDWADEILNASEFATLFEVEDCDHNPQTGAHHYFNETGQCLTISIDGNLVIDSDSTEE